MQALVYGIHGVGHALRRCGTSADGRLYVRAGISGKRISALCGLAQQLGIEVVAASTKELDHLCADGVHQGVALSLRQSQPAAAATVASLLQPGGAAPLLLVLDQVQDPHNLGACLRSAEAAGATGVIVPGRRSAPLSAVVRKVSCGASELVPVARVANLRQALDSLRQSGVWVVGMDSAASQSIYQLDLCGPLAVVLGSEGRGLRRLTRDHCDYLAKIPMHGAMESINVSAAAAVALFEAVRQRHGAA